MIEKLYTVEEVAELASVTGRTIRNYLKSGRLVGRKIGGQWRFPQGEVQRLLAGGLPELAEDLPPESEHFFAKEAPAFKVELAPKRQEEPMPQQNRVYSEPQNTPLSPVFLQQNQRQEEFFVNTAQSPQSPFYPNIAAPGQGPQNYPESPALQAPAAQIFAQGPAGQNSPFVFTSNGVLYRAVPQNAPAQQPLPPQAQGQSQKSQAKALPLLSDVGSRVAQYISEVYDYSKGPQVCAVVDLHQVISDARLTVRRLEDIAEEESENGLLCQCFLEFDERFYVARYTFFGTTPFLLRCLKLIG